MESDLWQEILLPQTEDSLWELFHENTKNGRHAGNRSKADTLDRMSELQESLRFEGHPRVPLPQPFTLPRCPLAEALANRASSLSLSKEPLPLTWLAALLYYAYGITRDNIATTFPRPFRATPSAGALYPLEIFFHASRVEGLQPGLYHYSPVHEEVRLLQGGDSSDTIAGGLIQQDIAANASAIMFMTALFERTTFKYGDRGYRYILIEAGHAAQNMNLVGTALGLGMMNIGGFLDREIDDYLGLDGVTHSTLYLLAVGGKVG